MHRLKMRYRNTYLIWLVLSTLSLRAFGACVLPPAPSKIPEGASADGQEMIAAMQTLKRYNTDVTNYVKCLEFEARQNRLSRQELGRQNDLAVASLQSIAATFNEQVRIFKARAN